MKFIRTCHSFLMVSVHLAYNSSNPHNLTSYEFYGITENADSYPTKIILQTRKANNFKLHDFDISNP